MEKALHSVLLEDYEMCQCLATVYQQHLGASPFLAANMLDDVGK